jgi:hypothetical protein
MGGPEPALLSLPGRDSDVNLSGGHGAMIPF